MLDHWISNLPMEFHYISSRSWEMWHKKKDEEWHKKVVQCFCMIHRLSIIRNGYWFPSSLVLYSWWAYCITVLKYKESFWNTSTSIHLINYTLPSSLLDAVLINWAQWEQCIKIKRSATCLDADRISFYRNCQRVTDVAIFRRIICIAPVYIHRWNIVRFHVAFLVWFHFHLSSFTWNQFQSKSYWSWI